MDPESQRFHAFKMGGTAPPNSLHARPHRRSRSRASLSLSLSAPALSPPPDDPPASLAPPPNRPHSHHRRRSSVSTRRESAELMGVPLPDLPHSDDTLADRDSIRRRALRALEGKLDTAFAKVEIPDIPSADFPSRPSFPPGLGLSAVAPFAPKRDSFGKMFATSGSKDQLGTLVEEEEEEEDEDDAHDEKEHPPKTRHRPASLNLRPLSLVQGSVVSPAPSLPTPSSTPSTHPSPRKFITAAPDDTVLPIPIAQPSNATISARQVPSSKRFSYSFHDSPMSSDFGPRRRSSISYKRSPESVPRDALLLPTPDVSPIDRRFSFASDQETLVDQPLSVADQHFLFRSHHALLSRITDLERTLRNRASFRHHSYASDASTASSEPSNEMLHLISDLKAERDELKRDVDGWRQRVSDADKQTTMLANLIEAERKEAWVAHSRLGLLEVEKTALEKSLEAKTVTLSQCSAENTLLTRERNELKDEILKLSARLKDTDAALDECARLRSALEQERTRRKELEKLLDDAGLLNTPKLPNTGNGSWRRPLFSAKLAGARPRGLGFQSVDSESSTTDVESLDDSFTKAEFTLDAVTEEEGEYSDEENALAGYEDEEDSDLSFSSPDGSCVGLADEKSSGEDILDHTVCPSQPTHVPRASLSKTWTFPRGTTVVPVKQDDEVDRFFGCLEDGDRSPPFSEEMNKNMFSSAFRSLSDDNELPPFILPLDVGVVDEPTPLAHLGLVPEEDEDEELVGEEVEGGIRFTFNAPPIFSDTPPADVCSPPPPEIRITPPTITAPIMHSYSDDSIPSRPISIPEPVEDDEDESSLNLVFPPKIPQRPSERVNSPPRSSPPRPSSRTNSPPSSIPRAVSLRPKAPAIMFTPSKNVSGRPQTTPPKKTSSVPLPVTPPKSCSTPRKVQSSGDLPRSSQPGSPNGSTPKPHSTLFMTNDAVCDTRFPRSSQVDGVTPEVNRPGVCEYSHGHQDTSSSLSSIMSNPLAARSPFQKLSHLISFAWTPGATTVASYIVPRSSSPDAVSTAASLSDGTIRRQRKFVSKERQLEKLKRRISLEEKGGVVACCMVNACKGCSAGEVYL